MPLIIILGRFTRSGHFARSPPKYTEIFDGLMTCSRDKSRLQATHSLVAEGAERNKAPLLPALAATAVQIGYHYAFKHTTCKL